MIEKTFLMYFLVLPISLGVGITLMGLVLLFIDSRRHKKYISVEMDGWETIGGKVLTARLEECQPAESDPKGSQVEPAYQPVIEFVYNVQGMEYSGNNIFPGAYENFNKVNAQAFLDKYPQNSYVPVRFDPKEPTNSALEDQPRRSNRIRLVGLLFTWFGISVCCFSSLMIFIMSANIL